MPACELDRPHRSRSSGSSAAKVEKPAIDRMWAASRTNGILVIFLFTSEKIQSFIFEHGLSLLHEGGHALFLVVQRELRMEHAPLDAHALGQRGLVGAVD